MKLISTKEAAEKLGVSTLRVQQLIWDGRLPAQKVGRDYVIDESNLKLVKDRKPGRPRKDDKKPTSKASKKKVSVK